MGLWFLLAGLVGLALADSTYAYFVNLQQYTTGNLLDVGWFVGFLGIALGALTSDRRRVHLRAGSASPALPSLVAPLVPMLVALCVAAFRIDLGDRPDWVAVTMVLALVLLAVVRMTLLVLEYVATSRGRRESRAADRPLPRAVQAMNHAETLGASRILYRPRTVATGAGYAATLTTGLAGRRLSSSVVGVLIIASAGISLYDLHLVLAFLAR
jgi:hypothetical protein